MSGPGAARADALPGELARLLHDLRGPLNSAVMHLEVVKRGAAGDAVAGSSLETALAQLGRLAELLPLAFEVACVELGRVTRVDLRAVAAEAVARHPGSTVRLGPAPWPAVVGDERLLVLAVDHLVRNALEAGSGRGADPPDVAVAVEGDAAVLAVHDRGPGLRSCNPRVLIRLGQSTKAGHRGVGLLTVERIARLHGGRLTFESSAADGARVALHLPVAP